MNLQFNAILFMSESENVQFLTYDEKSWHKLTNTMLKKYYLRFLISVTFPLFGIVIISATKLKMVKEVQYYYKYATKKQEGTTIFLFHHLNYSTLLWSQLSLSTFLSIPPLSLCCTY